MPPKQWNLRPPAPPEVLASYTGMSRVLAQALYNRDLKDAQSARHFLELDNANEWTLLKSKGRNRPIDRAISRVMRAIEAGERIAIYGDFDADGVTATALMVQALRALNAKVEFYIPNRVDEGYGLNSAALRKLRRDRFSLIITVDCGIRSVQEIEDANAVGLDVIITDHHSIGPEIPNAYAVLDPKLHSWGHANCELAGVGIAYRLCEALFTAAKNNTRLRLDDFDLDGLLDLVAIGTIADLAPINNFENRVLVRRGLEILNQTKRPGIRALLEVAGIKPGAVNAESIGFALGPRINAAGRLETADIALQLLLCDNDKEAQRLATALQVLNSRRQELTRQAQEIIRLRLQDAAETDAPLIFGSDASFQEGIVGLVAGRLTEEFYRPAVILKEGEHESRASCRSIPQFDITRALDQCADLLVRHGGHAQAAGFTIVNENIPQLKERLLDIARRALDGQALRPALDIDAEVEPAQLTLELAQELRLLEPTGHHNETPVLMTRGLKIADRRRVGRREDANGKREDHLKLKLMRPGSPPVDAIGFRMGNLEPGLPGCVDVAYTLEINEYNGTRAVQLKLEDIRPGETE